MVFIYIFNFSKYMYSDSFGWIKEKKRKHTRSREVYCCITCNSFQSDVLSRFTYITIDYYYSNYLKPEEIKKYNICYQCRGDFFELNQKQHISCNCGNTHHKYLCGNCNSTVNSYIHRNCLTYNWPYLCEDPIYHRFCDCEYDLLIEQSEWDYNDKIGKGCISEMGQEFFNLEKFHNTNLFNRHQKKTLKEPDNWEEESRRIRYIEPCSTKPGGQCFYYGRELHYTQYLYYEKKFLYFQYWHNWESDTFERLHFKCDNCPEKAIFESSDGEYLCYQCNEKIESEIEKETKVSKPSKFSVQKYQKEYEHNGVRKFHKKKTTKDFLKDYDDSHYKEFSKERPTVVLSDKEISDKPIVLQQKLPPFWCETIHSDTTSWVSRIAPEKEAEKKLIYEEAYPKLPSYTCSVCFEDSGHRTKCKHLVCKKCIERWSQTRRNCPKCRTPI